MTGHDGPEYPLGIAYQLKGEFQNAIETFVKAIDFDQNYVIAYNSLALTYKRLEQHEHSAEVSSVRLNSE